MTVRVGIMGTGWIAQEHAIALAAIPQAELVGVSSATPGRAERFATNHRIPRHLTHEELVASEEIDAVHICTRNFQHHDQCLAAMRAGKHVVAEKPLALSVKESQSLLDASAPRDRVRACNYNYRAYPAVQEARRFIESGELGEIYLVHGTYLQDWLLLRTDYNWRLDAAQSGNSSAMADIGTHLFDLVEHVTGAHVESIQASLRTTLPERLEQTANGSVKHRITGDDCATISFKLATGALGSLVVSQVSAGRKNHLSFEISGAGGSLFWSQEDPELLWIGRREGGDSIRVRNQAMAPDEFLPPGHPFGWRDALRRNLRSVYAAIDGKAPALPFATFADGHRSLVLLEAALASSSADARVSVRADGHIVMGR